MTGYVLSEDAEEDLQGIYRYSERNWGEQQARRYVSALFDLFERLGRHPQLGRSRGELGEGIRSFAQGAHLTFYMEWGGEVAILRVLHGRMDFDAAFEGYDPLPDTFPKRT